MLCCLWFVNVCTGHRHCQWSKASGQNQRTVHQASAAKAETDLGFVFWLAVLGLIAFVVQDVTPRKATETGNEHERPWAESTPVCVVLCCVVFAHVRTCRNRDF